MIIIRDDRTNANRYGLRRVLNIKRTIEYQTTKRNYDLRRTYTAQRIPTANYLELILI